MSLTIGSRIRQLRAERKLSQGDIENKTGLLRCYISRVENGHTVPSLETLERFAEALDLPLYRLFCDESESPAPTAEEERSSALLGKPARKSPSDPFLARIEAIIPNLSEDDRAVLLSLAEKLNRNHSGK